MLFFCDRLLDHHSVQPLVIYGLVGLLSHQNVNNSLVVKMLQCMFAEVHVQSMTQSDRWNVFNLFSVLLSLKLDVLKGMSADFVLGFIQAMDSERDPRNLLLCFTNSYTVLCEIDTSLFTEDFFEVLSCYFPIDFKPPKDNPFEITKQDLVLSLRKCLTCCKEFAPYAVPLYIEKLSSDVLDAKLDALLTFTESLKTFPATDVQLFAKDIWMLIRKDFLLSEEVQELKEPYIDFIRVFIMCLLKSAENKEPLFNVVDQLTTDCLQTLKDPDMTIAVPCGELIFTVSNLSADLFIRILDKVLPPIELALSKYSSNPQRTSVFEMVLKILQVDAAVQNDGSNHPLAVFVDKHLSMMYSFLSNMDSTQLQSLGLKCLIEIVRRQMGFGINTNMLSQHVFKMAFSNIVLSKDVFDDLKNLVAELSMENPELVSRDFISPLTTKSVQENLMSILESFEQCVQLLYPCCYANFKRFGKVALSYLINTALEFSTDGAGRNFENIFNAATKCCSAILKDCGKDETVDQNIVLQPLIQKLLVVDLQHQQLQQQQQQSPCFFFNGFISVLSSAFKRLDSDQQRNILVAACRVLEKRDVPAIVVWSEATTAESDEMRLQTVCLLSTGIVSQVHGSLLKHTVLDTGKLLTVLWEIMKEHSGNDFVLEHVGMCVASIVNKAERSEFHILYFF